MSALPDDIHTLADYERHAATRLPPAVWGHIQEGSGFHGAPDNDRVALDRLKLLPRRLTDLRGGSTAISLFGQHHAAPILLAPVAYQRLAHPEGELATVRAATAMGLSMILSTLSSVTLEEVAQAARDAARQLAQPEVPHWFQLYAQPDRDHTLALIRRAEDAGYQAIAFTVDAAVKRAGFPLPPGVEAANLRGFPTQQQVTNHGAILFGTPLTENAPRWEDLAWLRQHTSLPLLIKGLAAPEDARMAAEMGADAVVISHHGGRVLPGMPSALELIAPIREAVGPTFPLLVDGGLRSGTDIAKALALGAQAVLVGRPQMHALAVGGFTGVAHMLHIVRAELELAMAQLGCASVSALGPRHLFRGP
ncbi:alpha-hydroxy acid oxidase [Novosphingobium rosa]|uniref:alpha-hydroxy acid oxidase n=1 Tax=Novosphingobium rosa TaxID=76978 RepID=UPI000AA95AC7|nr:alpha-hydroxy acid oxidase [Novosphingobium rosa]